MDNNTRDQATGDYTQPAEQRTEYECAGQASCALIDMPNGEKQGGDERRGQN
jgi:hypothetical protein